MRSHWDLKFTGDGDPSRDNDYPEQLAALSHHDYMERGGAESVEMILWLAMRAALGARVRRVHRNYHAPLITGYGLLALEP